MCERFIHFSDPPLPPESLSVTDTQPDSVTLAWTVPTSDGGTAITNYIIEQRLVEKSKFTEVGKADGKTLSYKAEGLKKDKDYMFRVKSENSAGVSLEGTQLEKAVTAKLSFGMGPIFHFRFSHYFDFMLSYMFFFSIFTFYFTF